MNETESDKLPADRGKEVEAIVEKICNKMFLPDLTVANPKFKKGGKLEKEIADVIIPYKQSLICFQIKSKTELKPLSEKTESDMERIRRRIEDGIGQLKMMRVCLKRELITELKNHRGIIIPFDCKLIKKVYGIVILELLGEGKFPEHERTSILHGFDVRDEMPIHIFKLDVFDAISSEIDTIPDFLDYLDVRELLIAKGQLNPFTEELDFLAIYKTKQDVIRQLKCGEITHLAIEEDLWKHHITINKEIIETRNESNKPSYIWDDMIKKLYTSVGFNPEFKIPVLQNAVDCQGTAKNYYSTLIELSGMRRIERRAAGTKLLEILARADKKEFGYGFIGSSNQDGLNLVLLATNKPREERAKFLLTLCSIFYCGRELRKVIGLATEPGSHRQRSFDTICLKNISFENEDEIRTHYRRHFTEGKRITVKEYGEMEQD